MLGRMAGLRSAMRQREQKWPNLQKAWATRRKKAALKRPIVPSEPAFIQREPGRNEVAQAEIVLALANVEAQRRREIQRQGRLALERARARCGD